jgi:hypothetical protein
MITAGIISARIRGTFHKQDKIDNVITPGEAPAPAAPSPDADTRNGAIAG